jgi:hypothetical protein
MTEQSDKLKEIIEKGSEVGGSVAGAVIGLAIAGPVGAVGGAAVGPMVALAFKKIGTQISELFMSPREEARVGATITLALEKIAKEIEGGKSTRNDDFFSPQTSDRSKADTLLEGTLLRARNEYEEKKIKFYSSFLANLNFDESVSFEKGNTLLRILEKLSYRQISILGYFEEIVNLDTKNWMVSFSELGEMGRFQDFYSELMDLYNQQLLQQSGTGITMSVNSMKLSPLGRTMCNLLNTKDVEVKDKEIIKGTIQEINRLKKVTP